MAAHYPKYLYRGREDHADYFQIQNSWVYQPNDEVMGSADPFAYLKIKMDFCETTKTSARYFHFWDWTWELHPNPGHTLLKIGDEAHGLNGEKPDLIDGRWIECRVGTCSFSVSSPTLPFEDLKNLADIIAKAVPSLPQPSAGIRKLGETDFLQRLENGKDEERKDREYTERLKTKSFVTAGELYSKAIDEKRLEDDVMGENGFTEGASNYEKETGVTEIAMEREGGFWGGPRYAVKITSDGRVQYFGHENVTMLGNHIGKIPVGKYIRLAQFVKDANIAKMHDNYEYMITDNPTTITAFVIDGKQKLIRNYAASAPSVVWMIEEMLDKLVSETEWDSPAKPQKKK